MKQITSILIIFIAAGIICTVAVIPINRGIVIFYSNNFDRMVEIFENKTPYDMLFIGSSRTLLNIYPRAIDSICGTNSYNAGITGARMMDYELILKGYLTNHPAPKTLVLIIDLLSFGKKKEIRQHTEYYPFLNNGAICQTLEKYGYHPDLAKMLPFYGFTELDDYNKENVLRILKGKGDTALPGPTIKYKGFISILGKLKPYGISKVRYDIYDESLASLDEVIGLCRKSKIKLVFAYAPEYNFENEKLTTNSDTIFSVISQKARANGIPFLRDDSLELCKDKDLFWNQVHLNEKGAIMYSAVMAQELKAILSRKDPVN